MFNWKNKEEIIYVHFFLDNGTKIELRITEDQVKEIEKASSHIAADVASLQFSYADGKKYLIPWNKICAIQIVREMGKKKISKPYYTLWEQK